MGDWLWALLGIPWLASAVLQSAAPGSEPRPNTLFAMTLSIGLAIVCMIAHPVVWSTWVMVLPDQAARMEAAPWTNRVGLILVNRLAYPMWYGHGRLELRLHAFVGQAFLPDTDRCCQARKPLR